MEHPHHIKKTAVVTLSVRAEQLSQHVRVLPRPNHSPRYPVRRDSECCWEGALQM